MDYLTVREALPIFYEGYELEPNGGVDDPTVTIKLVKGVTMFIPNFDARRKVILKHDIHHILTGYTGVMKGETEISAWELSTGCTNSWVAFTINTYGMMTGVLFNPGGLWKAWLRGTRTRNLYHEMYKDEELLDRTVEGLKKELGLFEDGDHKGSSFGAVLSFSGFLIYGIVFSTASIIILPFFLAYSLSISIAHLWRKQ
ncbi:MAG: hypothetical protein IH946_01300 [Bacteroidetes bacterium]|nr:hypothetical protein [Bacteroidota bacterium]